VKEYAPGGLDFPVNCKHSDSSDKLYYIENYYLLGVFSESRVGKAGKMPLTAKNL
jgi:hypothetical protein